MDIEQYLHRTDPFRSISFANPDPMALKVTTITAEEDPTQHLHHEIYNTLERHGLPPKSHFYVVNATIPGDRFPLRCVIVAGDNSASVPLGSLKDDLITLLNNYTLSRVRVEVINGDHFYIPALFPIHLTADLATEFQYRKDEIVRVLDETLGTKWQLVSPFNIGKDARSARPALVVGVPPSTKANWHRVQAHLTYHTSRLFSQMSSSSLGNSAFSSGRDG
jgi:hypothetical protein